MARQSPPPKSPRGYVPLEGSERHPSEKARRLGPADPAEVFSVTVLLRRRPDGPALPDDDYFLAVPPAQRPRLSDEEFARLYGASPEDLDAVLVFAAGAGLEVVESSAARRTVVLRGTVAAMSAAFRVQLARYQHEINSGGRREPETEIYRGRDGVIFVPISLRSIVVGVFGLDNRRVGKRNDARPPNTNAVSIPTMARLYNYPTNSAAGQNIGIFSGSGYAAADVTACFAALPAGHPAPTLTDILINGATNPGSDPFIETTQDIEIAAAFAPGAGINVYITTLDQQGWVGAINRVAHPNAGDPVCSVFSSSWYICDGDDAATLAAEGITTAYVQAVSSAFADAAIQGVTVCIGSGDTGTDSKVGDGKAHVQYPGSDPWVLAVGGTTVGNINGSAFDEYVWNDSGNATGGGVSDYFPVPSYQSAAGVPASVNDATHRGRGVPDIAGNANPASGYSGLVWAGSAWVGNGTSASAPQWAGLIAVMNAALGVSLGFVNPALYALRGAGLRDIVHGGGPADNGVNGVTGYPAGAGWDACTGWGSPDGVALLASLGTVYNRSLYFIVDKSTFGRDEVSDVITQAGGLYSSAFWLVLEGFSISQLGATMPALSGPFYGLTGVTIFADAAGAEYEFPGDLYTPQRIRIPYDIIFASTALTASFPAPNADPAQEPLIAQITVAGAALTAAALFELVAGADPYFTNIDPINRQDFYLSQDLRIFSAAAGDTPVPGAPAFTSDPYQSIKNLLGYLNSTPAYTVPGPDPLNGLPGQTGYETADSSVSPLNGAGNQNFNFAIARVRLQGAVGDTASRVRVFFRLFVTQSCDTDFQPTSTYKSDMGSGADAGHPVFPQPSGGGITDPAGNSLQTIPFFATDGAGTHDYDGTDPNANIRDVIVPMGRDRLWAYFGCFLNVYDSNNQALFPGTHHCIVAEIAYDQAPIINANGVTLTPESSDKLAQRNLQITASGNPGYPDTHLIPQTFDTRPSQPAAGVGELLDYPDELMIDWGDVPVGSLASIYWPAANATDVMALATRLYGRNPFAAPDPSTLSCRTTAGVTYVPIPYGSDSLAGLFTVELPNGIHVGQEFKVRVRRLTSRAAGERETFRAARLNASENGVAVQGGKSMPMLNWRYVTGTFQVTVPVVDDHALRVRDETTLAILKWRLAHFAPTYRWRPVVERYIRYLSLRIDGAGGDAESVKPSLSGLRPDRTSGDDDFGPSEESLKGALESTGKIAALVFDKFGDFEGFWLETWSERLRFYAREHEIEDLCRQAWAERILISVFSQPRERSRPFSILLRRTARRIPTRTH